MCVALRELNFVCFAVCSTAQYCRCVVFWFTPTEQTKLDSVLYRGVFQARMSTHYAMRMRQQEQHQQQHQVAATLVHL